MLWLSIVLILAALAAFFYAKSKAVALENASKNKLHSRAFYHGTWMAICSVGPAFFLVLVWVAFREHIVDKLVLQQIQSQLGDINNPQIQAFMSDVRRIASGGTAFFYNAIKQEAANLYAYYLKAGNWYFAIGCGLLAGVGFVFALRQIKLQYRARHRVEQVIKILLFVSSAIAVFATIGIVFSLLFETINFFGEVSFFDFLFGMHWSPQSAFEGAGDEKGLVDNSLVFGAVPLFAGTLLITAIAMALAGPVGLMSAIYLSEYSSTRFRHFAKPLLEILAGIPTVVYGFFAVLNVAPLIRGWGENLGLGVSSESALAAGLVMGIMIIPFVSSLSDDVINSVPQSLRDGSYAMGATQSETIRRVVLPAALPGVVSALLLAVSRAVGETMIVVMAAGLAANLTINPLEAVTTVTVQIVTLLVGDQEFDSAKTLAAFALGLTLFCITLILNVIALRVVQKYREQYD